MTYEIIPDGEALGTCAWCQEAISSEMEVFGFGARLKPDVDLSAYESHCIQIGERAEAKPVYMMVTATGSEAKENGNDGMSLVCSEACGRRLQEALKTHKTLGKLFAAVQEGL